MVSCILSITFGVETCILKPCKPNLTVKNHGINYFKPSPAVWRNFFTISFEKSAHVKIIQCCQFSHHSNNVQNIETTSIIRYRKPSNESFKKNQTKWVHMFHFAIGGLTIFEPHLPNNPRIPSIPTWTRQDRPRKTRIRFGILMNLIII